MKPQDRTHDEAPVAAIAAGAKRPRPHAHVLAASVPTPTPATGGVWWFDEATQQLMPGERPAPDTADEGDQP